MGSKIPAIIYAAALTIALTDVVSAAQPPVSELSIGPGKSESAPAPDTRTDADGGHFDDGVFDYDWFDDYYEMITFWTALGDQTSSLHKAYQAEQLYEDVRTSGLFDF